MSIPLVVSPVCLPGVVIPMQRVGVSIVFHQHARGEQQQAAARSSKQQASSRQAAGILEAEEMLLFAQKKRKHDHTPHSTMKACS